MHLTPSKYLRTSIASPAAARSRCTFRFIPNRLPVPSNSHPSGHHETSDDITPHTRRGTLSAIIALPLAIGHVSAALPAKAAGLTSSTLAGAYVVPAQKVPAYLARINSARPQAWDQFREYIDKGRYKIMAESLVLSPFDDVFQSCFYIPWALLPIDEARAASAQAAYNTFRTCTEDLNAVCIRAARYTATEAEVVTALDNLDASLTRFLEIVNV